MISVAIIGLNWICGGRPDIISLCLQFLLIIRVYQLIRLSVTLIGLEESAGLVCSLANHFVFVLLLRGLKKKVLVLSHDTFLLRHKSKDVGAWYRMGTRRDCLGTLALGLTHHTALLDHCLA